MEVTGFYCRKRANPACAVLRNPAARMKGFLPHPTVSERDVNGSRFSQAPDTSMKQEKPPVRHGRLLSMVIKMNLLVGERVQLTGLDFSIVIDGLPTKKESRRKL